MSAPSKVSNTHNYVDPLPSNKLYTPMSKKINEVYAYILRPPLEQESPKEVVQKAAELILNLLDNKPHRVPIFSKDPKELEREIENNRYLIIQKNVVCLANDWPFSSRRHSREHHDRFFSRCVIKIPVTCSLGKHNFDETNIKHWYKEKGNHCPAPGKDHAIGPEEDPIQINKEMQTDIETENAENDGTITEKFNSHLTELTKTNLAWGNQLEVARTELTTVRDQLEVARTELTTAKNQLTTATNELTAETNQLTAAQTEHTRVEKLLKFEAYYLAGMILGDAGLMAHKSVILASATYSRSVKLGLETIPVIGLITSLGVVIIRLIAIYQYKKDRIPIRAVEEIGKVFLEINGGAVSYFQGAYLIVALALSGLVFIWDTGDIATSQLRFPKRVFQHDKQQTTLIQHDQQQIALIPHDTQ